MTPIRPQSCRKSLLYTRRERTRGTVEGIIERFVETGELDGCSGARESEDCVFVGRYRLQCVACARGYARASEQERNGHGAPTA